MDINIKPINTVNVVSIVGDIDGNTAPAAQTSIVALAVPASKVVLDLSQVGYMSSAGLRMLLASYRAISGQGGKVVVCGLSEDLEDTMSMTGFLSFFTRHNTVDESVAALN